MDNGAVLAYARKRWCFLNTSELIIIILGFQISNKQQERPLFRGEAAKYRCKRCTMGC